MLVQGDQCLFCHCPFPPGFAAVDLTVMCMTEVMWAFVLQDTNLLDVVLSYTIKFLLAPVSAHCHSGWFKLKVFAFVLGFSPVSLLFACGHANVEAKEGEGKEGVTIWRVSLTSLKFNWLCCIGWHLPSGLVSLLDFSYLCVIFPLSSHT